MIVIDLTAGDGGHRIEVDLDAIPADHPGWERLADRVLIPQFDPEDYWFPCFEGERPPDKYTMYCGDGPCQPCATTAEMALRQLDPEVDGELVTWHRKVLGVVASEAAGDEEGDE